MQSAFFVVDHNLMTIRFKDQVVGMLLRSHKKSVICFFGVVVSAHTKMPPTSLKRLYTYQGEGNVHIS